MAWFLYSRLHDDIKCTKSHSRVCIVIFSGMLRYSYKMLSVVVCLWRECIVTKRLKLGSCSFYWNLSQCLISCLLSLIPKFDGVPWSGGSNWGGVVFDRVRDAITRKWYERKLRWQLITDRKSYVRFQLQQKTMTLNDLERQFTALSSVLCVLWPNGRG